MAIFGMEQPGGIPIGETLRLRKYDGEFDFALIRYQDPELVWLVDGKREPYDRDLLSRMYRYLNNAGELYFIEVLIGGRFTPIGYVSGAWVSYSFRHHAGIPALIYGSAPVFPERRFFCKCFLPLVEFFV